MEEQAHLEPQKKKKRYGRWIAIGIAVFFLYIGLLIWIISGADGGIPGGGGGIAQINIDGVISGDADSGGDGVGPQDIINQLYEAENDPFIEAILLRINSPGGTAGSSQEIASEVEKMDKPVIASVGDIGASGAYWIASAADKIVAGPASEVGSIGVILSIPNLQELFKKLGIDLQVIAQGKYKDIGNPARPLTPQEKQILTQQSAEIYDLFVKEIAKARKMKVKKVLELANGLTYTGEKAKKLGLVDELGNFNDAIDLAAKMGKIEGEPEIVSFEEEGFLDIFPGILGGGLLTKINLFLNNQNSMMRLMNTPKNAESVYQGTNR